MTDVATTVHLLIRDTWVPIPDVIEGTEATFTRPRRDFTTLGGKRFEQFAAKASRVWRVSYSRDSEDGAILSYVAQGLAGPDVWLYDVAAAQLNLLPPSATQGPLSQASTLAVGSVPMPVLPDSTEVWSLPLRGGVEYTLYGWSDAAEATVLGSLSAGGDLVAAAGAGSRVASHTFTPASDGTVSFTTGTANLTGLRLAEGSLLPDVFMPGEGVPCRVVVDDPARSYSLVQSDRAPWIDQSFVIRQVG